MAGERLARQTIFLTQGQLQDGDWVQLYLAGNFVQFTGLLGSGSSLPLNTPRSFTIYTPSNANAADLQRLTVESFTYALQQWLLANGHGSHYTLEPVMGFGLASTEVAGVALQATTYDPNFNFLLPYSRDNGLTGFSWFLQLTNTIRPVQVAVAKTDTGAFGTADGTIALTASNGTAGVYTYRWADPGAPLTAARTGLAAGTYTGTVTDASGASTTVVVVVGSDARLDVLVERTDNDVTLVPSGGRAPYTYQWADGPAMATRRALAIGTYTCTVTDARGATQLVTVVVDPYRFYWSKNPVTLRLDAGDAYRLDPTTKPNLSFVCQVWVEEVYGSGVFVQVGGELEQPADRAGRTVFDAQLLLDSYLREHLPALNQARPSRADSLFRRFYFRYAEKYGAPPVAAAHSTQAQHYVVFGGLDFFEAPAGTWFSAYQAGAKPFLTWEPDNKAVLPTQPEYLYFMPDSFELAAFELQVRVYYADGTRAQLTAATVTGVRRFEVYCLPVGYQQLGLHQAVGATPAVVAWEVWVRDPATGLAQTETRRFALNPDYVARPRFFLYTNSLGGVNSLACVGEAKTALDVKAETADRAQGPGADPLLGDALVLDRSGVLTLAMSSGKLRRDQLVAAQDFLLSRRVTLQSGGAYFPGQVKAKSIGLVDEAPGELNNLEFDFLLPRQRLFSPRLPVASAGQPVMPVRGGEGAQP